MVAKSSVRIGDVPIAANTGGVWKFTTGVTPYQTVFQFHVSQKERIDAMLGRFVAMDIQNTRNLVSIRDVTILYEVPTDSIHRVAYVVADKRWKWKYKLIARDYNMTRKSGDRSIISGRAVQVPAESVNVRDKYDFKEYSLNDGQKWTPREIIEDIMEQLEGDEGTQTVQAGTATFELKDFIVESFSITRNDDEGLPVQNLTIRDNGDAALNRAIGLIPGVSVWVNQNGKTIVFDGSNIDAADQRFKELLPHTKDGDDGVFVDRKAVRPSKVAVYFQREVECLFDYSDDFSGGSTTQEITFKDQPYLDNVIKVPDVGTRITDYDPLTGGTVERTVAIGTWMVFKDALAAWDKDRPQGSLPWTFDTIKKHWLKGDLEGALGARGLDLDDDANIANRVAAIKQHFRQTFRVNQRYMQRIRTLQAVRVAVLDPVTGMRAPSTVWGQGCVVPNSKGKMIAGRRDAAKALVYRNIDNYPYDKNVKDVSPGPRSVRIVDRDQGVFRLDWIFPPSGTVESYVPCHLISGSDIFSPKVPRRDLGLQDDQPMGPSMKLEGGTNGIFLRPTLKLKVMLTLSPASPNSKAQMERIEIEPSEAQGIFTSDYHIENGSGPTLELFIPPTESTARWGWLDDEEATAAVQTLLGLKEESEGQAGEDDDPMQGLEFVNEEREVKPLARAAAAQALVAWADGRQGRVTTDFGKSFILNGNMKGAAIAIAGHPSGKLANVYDFPGQAPPISRYALLPESTRQLVLGIVPYGRADE